MSNVYVSTIEPPRIARNKRVYGGNVSVIDNKSIGSITEIHIESGRLTGLTSVNVVVYFAKVFPKTPTGWIKVYRMREMVTGKWKADDVLYYHADQIIVNEYGFGLVIDSSESLTGVIVEYCYL